MTEIGARLGRQLDRRRRLFLLACVVRLLPPVLAVALGVAVAGRLLGPPALLPAGAVALPLLLWLFARRLVGPWLLTRTAEGRARAAEWIAGLRGREFSDLRALVEERSGNGPSAPLIDRALIQKGALLDQPPPVFAAGIARGLRHRAWVAVGLGLLLATILGTGLGGAGTGGATLAGLSIEYRYPAWTGRTPERFDNTTGDVAAPVCTEVSLSGRLAGPAADAGELSVDGARQALDLVGDRFSGRFVVRASGGYRLSFDGRPSGTWRIEAVADRPPTVTVEGPPETIETDRFGRIEFDWRAEDDNGVAEVRLVWSAGRSGDRRRVTLERFSKPVVRASGRYAWDLGALDLGGEREIGWFVEAEDASGCPSPGVGTGRVRLVRLLSPLDRHERLTRAGERLVEEMLQTLGDAIEEWDETSGAALRPLDRLLAGRIERLERLAGLADEAEQGIGNGHTIREDLAAGLPEIAARYRSYRERYAALAGRNDPAGLPPTVRSSDRALQSELERDIARLVDGLERHRLDGALVRAAEIGDLQRKIAELAERYRRQPDPALLRELLALIDRASRLLDDMHGQLASSLAELPERFANPEALLADDPQAALDELKRRLLEGDLDSLDRLAAELGQRADGLRDRLQEGLAAAGREAASELQSRFDEVRRELQQLRDREAELQAGLDRIYRHNRERAAASMTDRLRQRRAGIGRELDRLEQGLDRDGSLDRATRRAIADRLSGIRRLLDAGRGAEAAEEAENLQQMHGAGLPGGGEGRGDGPGFERLAAGLAALRPGDDDLPAEVRAEMGRLRERQQNLVQQAGAASSRLNALGNESRHLPPASAAALGEALGAMHRTGQAIGKGDVGAARSRAGQAVERLGAALGALEAGLERAGREMQPAGRLSKQLRSGGGAGGGGLDRERVEVPGAAQDAPIEEMVRRVNQGMRRRGPERYEKASRAYLEGIPR